MSGLLSTFKVSSALLAASIFVLSGCGESNEPAASSENLSRSTVPAMSPDQADISTSGACENGEAIAYLCGVINGEDILQVGNSHWLLVSGMDGSLSGSDVNGKIHLVNADEKSVEILFPGNTPDFQQDTVNYPSCPGPLDTSNFSAHGLSLQKIDKGPEIYRLYMTSHGAREAIEVFEIDAFLKPEIKWVGCIPMPSTSWTNSVAVLNDGGFFATQFFDPGQHGIEHVMAGDITGHVFEWHPGQTVSVLAGTELAGANGIAVSQDERWVFVASFGTGELVRFDRSTTPVGKETVQLGINPDNVRWTSDGTLYIAGNNIAASCTEENCLGGWSVIEVTPYNLEINKVAGVGEGAALHDASSAFLFNDEIWVGTFSGDRLAILPR